LPGDNANDQSRVMTPNDAFKNKVSGIVMGRSLIKGNIKKNTQRLIDHLNR
jgi:orotidine-5'-phosphate decarboxylase